MYTLADVAASPPLSQRDSRFAEISELGALAVRSSSVYLCRVRSTLRSRREALFRDWPGAGPEVYLAISIEKRQAATPRHMT
jgi:hypothetical protein